MNPIVLDDDDEKHSKVQAPAIKLAFKYLKEDLSFK